MPDTELDDLAATPDEAIINEAQRRFKRARDWEAVARDRQIEDYAFANGDADNSYQWPNEIRRNRETEEKPCLTVNKTQQHCLMIMNDARQHKARVKISPVGDGATVAAAKVFEGVIRHIEYISNAQDAYDTASGAQIQAGMGYWRLITRYVNDDSFDQEIFIDRIRDPWSVYLDCDIQQKDGADARWGFIFQDIPRDKYKELYPGDDNDLPASNIVDDDSGWIREDRVRVAEYFRSVEDKDRLYVREDGETFRESEIPAAMRKAARGDKSLRARETVKRRIEWFKIAGDKIKERGTVPGDEIPIQRVPGIETVIRGEYDCKGHVRALIDPQRIYNYWTSAAVEFGALQSKTPYVGPMRAFQGLETYWDSANRINHAWLPYNDMTEEGQPIESPKRAEPPMAAPAFIEGMKIAALEMQMVSGQYDATMGAQSNERTGVAIQQRQRQGDRATYHFIDNMAMAIRRTGRLLLKWIPEVYDTERVVKIMQENGDELDVKITPDAKQALLVAQDQHIFNPSVGRYEVQADAGPDFATRRQETFNALVEILTRAPQLLPVVGDLLFKSADFNLSEEIAERLKRLVPSAALGGPTPEMTALEQKSQQETHRLSVMLENALRALEEERFKLKAKDQQKVIDVYKAVTDRLKLLAPTLSPEAMTLLDQQAVLQAIHAGLEEVLSASMPDLALEAAGQALGSVSAAPGSGVPQFPQPLPGAGNGVPFTPAPPGGVE